MVFLQRCEDYDKNTVLACVRALFAAHGGIERYARPGLRVVIKPNLVAKRKPEAAATTHPAIVWAVAKLCTEQGADVTIAESPGGLYEKGILKSLYKVCGIEAAAEEAGARLNFDISETEVENPEAMYLKKIKLITPVAEADTVINLAKLKTHGMMVYTGAVKNMFGCVAGLEKAEYHLNMSNYDDFANCIIDICLAAKPALQIIDAVVGMEKDGPTAGDPVRLGLLLSGDNPFHTDMMALQIIQAAYQRVPILRSAAARGLCPSDWREIPYAGPALEAVRAPHFKVKYNDDMQRIHFVDGFFGDVLSKMIRPKPVFSGRKCRRCGECVKCCPAKVIALKKGSGAKVTDLSRCIRCYCCQELCPFRAVKIKKPVLNKLFIR